jgi:hypothetical protein
VSVGVASYRRPQAREAQQQRRFCPRPPVQELAWVQFTTLPSARVGVTGPVSDVRPGGHVRCRSRRGDAVIVQVGGIVEVRDGHASATIV